MKKTLINTKFQWLMKYVNSENEEIKDGKISAAMEIKQKERMPVSRKILGDKANNLEKGPESTDELGKVKLPSSLLRRNCVKFRQRSITEQSIFMNKNKMRNKSVIIQTFRNKNNNPLADPHKKRTASKLKTEPIYDRSNIRERYWHKFEGEGMISPWGLGDNPSIYDFNGLL